MFLCDQQVWGLEADMSRPDDVEALAKFAVQHLQRVDIWINNAGQVSHLRHVRCVRERGLCIRYL